MKINYNRPAEQILYDLLFYTGGAWLPKDSLSFGEPRPLGPFPGDPYQRDTILEVTVGPAASDRQRGSVSIRYAKLNLGEQPQVVEGDVQVTSFPFTSHQLLPQLNALYGLQLDVVDLVNVVYREPSAEYAVQADPKSLVWRGGLTFTTNYVEVSLADIWLVTELSGLWYEAA